GSASLRLTSSTHLRLSGGRGITVPSLYQNFINTFVRANPSLKPETTRSYEAGIVQEWFGRRARTEVSVFRSSFTNLIAYIGGTWANIQASWARGVEVSNSMSLAGQVRFNVSYMRLYTRATTAPFGELYRRPR